MNEKKWYITLFVVLIMIIFFPIIAFALLFSIILSLLKIPRDKKEYMKSRYYIDLKEKFSIGKIYSSEYIFYNSAIKRGLQIEYIQQQNGLEYFIYNSILYLFPTFEELDYDEEKAKWQSLSDGEWINFDEEYQSLVALLEFEPKIPIKILVERKMILANDLNKVQIPESVFVTWGFDEAFEDEDSPQKMFVPKSTKELYEMMKQTNTLCGHFEMQSNDGNIIWYLYENACIEIGVEEDDCFFGISKFLPNKKQSGLTHWHPTNFEIYNLVRKIGKCGNVIVLKDFSLGGLSGDKPLYIGKKENCPYKGNHKTLFSKIYYLEAK